jgi:hypothetical protein
MERAKELDDPVITTGDLFCAMQGKHDPRRMPEDVRPEHMVNDYLDALPRSAAEWFLPYARQWALVGYGNHETSILRHNQVDLIRNFLYILANESGNVNNGRLARGGYGGRLFIEFRDKVGKLVQRDQVRYFHGSGGGGAVTKGTLKPVKRAAMWPEADFVITGHIHEAWVFPIKREKTKRGDVFHQIQHHIQVPTYKEEYGDGSGGFHNERERPPKPIGCARIQFYFWKGMVKSEIMLDII